MNQEDKLVKLEVTDLAFDGKSVAHRDGKVVFLNGGLPGETVEAEIVRSRPRYDRGIVHRILKKSDKRIEAVCQHFGLCGGCTWQDLDYRAQLSFKQKQVCDCLERLGGLKDVTVKEIIGSAEQFSYRNKMEFSFHAAPDGGFSLGLHRRGRFDEVFDLQECHLQSGVANSIVHWIRDFVATRKIPVYDVRAHTGYMRFLMIRRAVRTGEVMVNIVTNYGQIPAQAELVEGLPEAVPEVTTIVHNQTGKKSNVAVGEVETVLMGPGYIEEQILGARFRIRANSFFQTNSIQAETLYRVALEMLQPESADRALDLYCGTGAIGILLSGSVAEVIGVELVGEAVKAARENAEMNGVDNITFHAGDVKDFLKSEPAGGAGRFDAVVVDPPRAGLNPRALKRIVAHRPKKLLYVSCNPATFARDARELVQNGYCLPAVQPVDMFPHTMHIELIGRFFCE